MAVVVENPGPALPGLIATNQSECLLEFVQVHVDALETPRAFSRRGIMDFQRIGHRFSVVIFESHDVSSV